MSIQGHQSSSIVINRHQYQSTVISTNQPSSVPINRHQCQSTVISANQRAYSRVARPSVDKRRSEPGGRLRSNVRCRGRRARPMCVSSRSPRPQPRPLLRSPPRPPSPRHRDNTPVGHPTGAGQSVSVGAHVSPSKSIRALHSQSQFTASLSSQPVSVHSQSQFTASLSSQPVSVHSQSQSVPIRVHRRQS